MKLIKTIWFVLGILFVIKAQTFENYHVNNNPLPGNVVTSITIVNGTVWVTTDSGIASYNGIEWQLYTSADGLGSDYIKCSARQLGTTGNRLILGSDNGISDFTVDGPLINSPVNQLNLLNFNIVSNNILSVASWHDQKNWIGTDNGISMIQSDTIMNIQAGDIGIYLNNNTINALSVSRDTVSHKRKDYIPASGVVYAATNGGGVGRFYYHEVDGISSASVVENRWSGLPSDTVLSVFVDSKNNHWYGTPKGVASHQEHNSKYAIWKNYDTDDGLVHNRVTSITSDNTGNMWFGTLGGISRFDGGNWLSFTASDGLISNKVTDIEVDSLNNIWISTDKGLAKLSGATSLDGKKNISSRLFSLKLDAYPNPFNQQVNFKITLNKNATIRIRIFNMLGELVRSFTNIYYTTGEHHINWNARAENNQVVNSGIYLVIATADNYTMNRKIVFLK